MTRAWFALIAALGLAVSVSWCSMQLADRPSAPSRPQTSAPAPAPSRPAPTAPQPSAAPVPPDSGPVSLKARVSFTGTQLVVKNMSTDQHWRNITLTLNPSGILRRGYDLDVDELKPGQQMSVGAMQFAKSDGTRFNPFQVKPMALHISATVNGKPGFYGGTW